MNREELIRLGGKRLMAAENGPIVQELYALREKESDTVALFCYSIATTAGWDDLARNADDRELVIEIMSRNLADALRRAIVNRVAMSAPQVEE